jgi:hypothetical protein
MKPKSRIEGRKHWERGHKGTKEGFLKWLSENRN